jgi:oligopeptide/dipeptide ABC transporter ATP-binding protein
MANRIGVLYLGRLAEVSESKTLFREPRHPYTRMLLDAVPDLEMTGRQRKPVEGEIPNPIDPPPGCTFHPRCPFVFDRCRVEVPPLCPTASAKPLATVWRKAESDADSAALRFVQDIQDGGNMPQENWVDEVLAFWFEELGPADWYAGGEELDGKIRQRFTSCTTG